MPPSRMSGWLKKVSLITPYNGGALIESHNDDVTGTRNRRATTHLKPPVGYSVSDRRTLPRAELDCSEAILLRKAIVSNPNPSRPSTEFIFGIALLAAQPTTPPLQCKKSSKSTLDTVLRWRRRQTYFNACPQRLLVL
jgi:hypothetical protein